MPGSDATRSKGATRGYVDEDWRKAAAGFCPHRYYTFCLRRGEGAGMGTCGGDKYTHSEARVGRGM